MAPCPKKSFPHQVTAGIIADEQCEISRVRPAREINPGSSIVRVSKGRKRFEYANVTHVTRGRSMVRYVVTAQDTLIINDVLRLLPHDVFMFVACSRISKYRVLLSCRWPVKKVPCQCFCATKRDVA